MGNFEKATNWRAKNPASIKLRTSDGQKHELKTEQVAPTLTPEEAAKRLARRAEDAKRIQLERENKARKSAAAQKRNQRKAEEDAKREAEWAKKPHYKGKHPTAKAMRAMNKAAHKEGKAPESGNTPPGWVPANRRSYVDPLSAAADPRRRNGGAAPLPRKKKRSPKQPPKELQ